MVGRAERAMSAPPEVVFNTATDPARSSGWLPEPLRRGPGSPAVSTDEGLQAHWNAGERSGWSAELRVEPTAVGGTTVCLDLAADEPDQRLAELADASLAGLARQVADNLTAG